MGKTTLYHPVSLNVMRGALELHQFKVGKFVQKYGSLEKGCAEYFVPIISLPEALETKNLYAIKQALDSCFAADVLVTAVWSTPAGQLMARIQTNIIVDPGPVESWR